MNMEEIYQIIAMYAPTVLTALGVVATWVKVFKGVRICCIFFGVI